MSINTVADVKRRLLEIGANVPASDFKSFAHALEYLATALMEAAELRDFLERLSNVLEPAADDETNLGVMNMKAEALAALIAANHLRGNLQPAVGEGM